MRGRLVGSTCALLVASATLVGAGWWSSASAAAQLLPDLGMASVTTVTIDTTTIPGHRLLRYEARIVNVGAGAFEADGSRPDTTVSDVPISQRVFDDGGGSADVPITGTTMFWAGDGHNHWHIRDMESGTLTRLDNGKVVGTLAKHGFLIHDGFVSNGSLPGSPGRGMYTAGNYPSMLDPNALAVTEGLSVGWGDSYGAATNLQWVDITGLPNGKYRLDLGANVSGWFLESDTTNNTAWAILRIRKGRVNVLSRGGGV